MNEIGKMNSTQVLLSTGNSGSIETDPIDIPGLTLSQAMNLANQGNLQPRDVLAVSNAIMGGLAALGVVLAAPEALAAATTTALIVGAYGYATGTPAANKILQDLSQWLSSGQWHTNLSGSFIGFGLGLGNAISGAEKSFITALQALFHTAETLVSPIALDLNGDGIATTGVTAGTYFDHDGNGFAEQTGWVNGQDGILVRDLNGNSAIDNGGELFGSETLLANGQKAANGYAALAELDTNLDGKIDQQDAAYATLRIWKDANGDGYSSPDELHTLADAGVQSIATGYTAANQTDANGNTVKQTGTFTRTDGSTGNSADIWFKVDKTNTIATDWLPETETVTALPDLQGFGNVYDLHQAILRDTTGHLQDLVTQFSAESDPTARNALVTQIIYAWTGAENIDPASRGIYVDARKLGVMEKFNGELFVGTSCLGTPDPNPNSLAGPHLTQAYNRISEMVYCELMAQTQLKGLYDATIYTWSNASQCLKGDHYNDRVLIAANNEIWEEAA